LNATLLGVHLAKFLHVTPNGVHGRAETADRRVGGVRKIR
jgi:hypothetical protein